MRREPAADQPLVLYTRSESLVDAARPERLHFGCFDQPRDGWLNTDITPHIWITRIPLLPALLHACGMMSRERLEQHRAGVFRKVSKLDVAKRFPYADERFEAVYSSHVLEHMPPDDAAHCIREVYRVLVPGGVARIAVPDLDRRIRAYDPEQADEWVERLLETRQTRSKNRHHWLYNQVSLSKLFRDAGFSEIETREYREGRCPDVETMDHRPGSLIVEAIK